MPQISINALNGATFISTTTDKIIRSAAAALCQCPEWGDLHFYTDATYLAEHQNMCQCPKWGDLHFYYCK